MADVAAAAGVSQQTVSRVINNHPSVSTTTRQRVEEAVADLGYRRNPAARALVTGTSQTIGVLVSSTTLSGPSGTLLAIEPVARAHRYWVSIAGLRHQDGAEVADVIAHFIEQGVDGLIAVAQSQSVVDATLEACAGLPTVLITSVAAPGHSTVDIDQTDGADQAMTVLKGLGHRRIAHICGPEGDLHAEARVDAWRAAMAGEDQTGLLIGGDWSSISGYRAALTLLALDDPPTAVFASNDRMAYGVLRAVNARGLKVPGDISVVGFDDIEGSDCSIPPLTTIRQDHAALGAAAMELLLDAIAGGETREVKVAPHLVVRSSTGVARSGRV